MFTIILPCTGPGSHKIERILSKENIKVYHSTSNKLFQQLFTHKDKTEKNQQPGVYRIPCECGLAYIGETGRTITACKKKHYTCCAKSQTKKLSVAKHTWQTGHRIKWDKTTLLSNPKDYFSRMIRETTEIFKQATIPQEGQPFFPKFILSQFSCTYHFFRIHISIHISSY